VTRRRRASCRTSPLRADRSPDRRRDADVSVRTCGRPRDYTSEVSIVTDGWFVRRLADRERWRLGPRRLS
jgi:hypothetical protein